MSLFELNILDWIQFHLRTGAGDLLMPLITSLGNSGAIWLALTVLLLLRPKTRKLGLAVGISLALEVLCCNGILKPLVARVRPCDLNPSVRLLIPRPEDFSFPSGHTASSFAAASALYFGGSKGWLPAGALAALIAFSRLYLYVHFPSDVLAGALIGIMAGWGGAVLSKLLADRHRLLTSPNTKKGGALGCRTGCSHL